MPVPTKKVEAILIGKDGNKLTCQAEFFSSSKRIWIRNRSIKQESLKEVIIDGEHYKVKSIKPLGDSALDCEIKFIRN